MTDQLISLETAKLAKEKGFNWNTFYYYISHDTSYARAESFFDWNTMYKNSNRTSAPTQSLLQKWLRDKYNIHITMIYNNFNYYTEIVDENLGQIYRNVSTDTFENSLEKTLTAALILI